MRCQFCDTDKSFPYWYEEEDRVTPQEYLAKRAGLTWKRYATRPTKGVQLKNDKLEDALKAAEWTTEYLEFTPKEWEDFGIKNFSEDCYISVRISGNDGFKPVESDLYFIPVLRNTGPTCCPARIHTRTVSPLVVHNPNRFLSKCDAHMLS
jgi:hypothetical protein